MEVGTVLVLVLLSAIILFTVWYGSSMHQQDSMLQAKVQKLTDLQLRSKRYGDFIKSLHPVYLDKKLRLFLLEEQAKVLTEMLSLLPQDADIAVELATNKEIQDQLQSGQLEANAEQDFSPEAAIQAQAKLKTLSDFIEQLHQHGSLSTEAFKQYYNSLHAGFMQAEVDTEVAVGKKALEKGNVYAAHHHLNRALSILQPHNVEQRFQVQIDQIRDLLAQLQQLGQGMGAETNPGLVNPQQQEWNEYFRDLQGKGNHILHKSEPVSEPSTVSPK